MVNPVLVALDVPDRDAALSLARLVLPHVGGFKVGLELLMACGPSVISDLAELGLPVFADAKLHDIPNTVGGAAREIGKRGARWVTVHSSGGRAMVEAAVEGMNGAGSGGVLAVTVLTSLSAPDLPAIGVVPDVTELAVKLAGLAANAGAEGVVCSPLELHAIGRAHPGLIRVTPGIRPPGSDPGDQKRVATPRAALDAGADFLVVGRAITAAPDPAAEAARIANSILANP